MTTVASPEYSRGSWRARSRFLGRRLRQVSDLTPGHHHHIDDDDDGGGGEDDDDNDDNDDHFLTK